MAPEVRFSILGPVEVSIGGVPVSIGGPRVRSVLAALLIRAGSEVSASGLVDVVWGESPPPTVRTALQVHISKIRSALAKAGLADVLVTRGSSYVLHVPSEQLDSYVFSRLVAEGRTLLGQGAPADALQVLDEALRLWRGSPLGDIELPGLQDSVLRELEDAHDLAAVLRCEAQLALGLHEDALPALLRSRAESPMDERICELTALALYRAGRQSDALAELGGLRRALSEELGIEPGPAIANLEKRILVGDPDLAGEPWVAPREVRKTVTVVALRIPQGDPEEVLAATKALSSLFEGAVSNLDGWCPPAGSGRLLGIFGVPVLHEDDAVRALRTADALSRASTALGLEVRLGVSTGDVLAQVGSEVLLLTHDPVEVADLLARRAKPGEVLLGVATQRLVGGLATVDPAEILVIDNDEAPLFAHRLLGVADARVAPRLSAPLVGRESDLLRMHETAQRAFGSARPTVLAVLGSTGIGKTRLIEAFAAGLGDRVDLAVGRCLPYGRDVGFAPLVDILRSIVGIADARSASIARRRLRDFVGNDPDREVLTDLLGAVLRISDASSTRDEAFWAIRRCFEIGANRQPLAVFVEDLQWAEDRLLDAVGYVTSTVGQVPLLLVYSARPELAERLPSWAAGGTDTVTVRLDPLSSHEMDELLCALLASEDLDSALRRLIADSAEGNPLFLQEVLSVMIEDGHLSQQDGRWGVVKDFGAVPIPPSVKAVLDARVDLLPPAERDVLEAAAVVGREFHLDDLVDLRPESEYEGLVTALDALCRRGLVDLQRFTSRGRNAYAFRHLSIRDVVYGAIPRDRRAKDHRRLGLALIERAGERLGEVEEVIGFHLEAAFHIESGSPAPDDRRLSLGELAAEHLAAAGRRAVALDDAEAATSLFERAMSCVVPSRRQFADLARWRTATLFDLGRFEEAREVVAVGLESALAVGDPALQWRLRLEAMELDVYTRPGERGASETQSFAENAVKMLSRLDDPAGLARAYRLLGEALTLQGRLDDGLEAFGRGAEYAEKAGDEREAALPQQLMGLHGTTPLVVFRAQCEQLLSNRARRPRPEVVMRLAYALSLSDEGEQARSLIEEGLGLARDVGGAFRVADAELYAGLALLAMGSPSEAASLLASSSERLTEIGERNLRSTVEGFLGEAHARVSDFPLAAVAARACRALAAEDDWASQLLWRQVDAKVYAAQGNLARAKALICEAIEIADRTDFLTMAAAVHLDACAILELAGEPGASGAERETAAQLLRRKGVNSSAVVGGVQIGLLMK